MSPVTRHWQVAVFAVADSDAGGARWRQTSAMATQRYFASVGSTCARKPKSAARGGPISMRKSLSRPEQDEFGTSQTSIRHQPRRRRAMREYAVAPIHTSGVAVRHVGPPGCNLSPALDLDVEPRGPLLACLTHPRGCRASQRHACREPPGNREEASGGPGGGNCHPTSGFAAQSRHPVMPQNADTRFCHNTSIIGGITLSCGGFLSVRCSHAPATAPCLPASDLASHATR